MKADESAKLTQIISAILERNVDNRLTPDLATGILTMITHLIQPMIEAEATNDQHE